MHTAHRNAYALFDEDCDMKKRNESCTKFGMKFWTLSGHVLPAAATQVCHMLKYQLPRTH